MTIKKLYENDFELRPTEPEETEVFSREEEAMLRRGRGGDNNIEFEDDEPSFRYNDIQEDGYGTFVDRHSGLVGLYTGSRNRPEVVISPIYSGITSPDRSDIRFASDDDHNINLIYDGDLVFNDNEYYIDDSIYITDDYVSIYRIWRGNMVGLYASTGTILRPAYNSIDVNEADDGGVVFFEADGVTGTDLFYFKSDRFIDFDEDLDHVYVITSPFENSLVFLAQKNGYYYLKIFDIERDRSAFLVDDEYTRLNELSTGVVFYVKGASSGIIDFNDDKNIKVSYLDFDTISRFNRGVSIVSKDNKFGLIDLNYNIIVPLLYNHIKFDTTDNYAVLFNQDNKQSVIYLSGKENNKEAIYIIKDSDFIFASPNLIFYVKTHYQYRFCDIEKDGKVGLFDLSIPPYRHDSGDRVLLPPVFDGTYTPYNSSELRYGISVKYNNGQSVITKATDLKNIDSMLKELNINR